MPRRKPDGKTVIVHRYELGDFERRQLEDAKLAMAVRSAAPIAGAALIGAGIVAGGFMLNKSLDDLKEFWETGKEEIFGLGHTESEMQNAVQNSPAVTNQGALPNINPADFSDIPDFTGMSPSGIYDAIYEARSSIVNNQFSAWCRRHDFDETGYYWTHFRDNATGLLASKPRASTTVSEGEEVSMFTYQMCIRETAARRSQGRAVSGIVGALTTGWGLIGSEAVWRVGNALGIGHASNWTSGNARDAPAYIADILLDWCRTIVDFPGTDAATMGTYTYAGFFSRSSTNPDNTFNIGSRKYVEDILKIKSRLDDFNVQRDVPMLNHLETMWPTPP